MKVGVMYDSNKTKLHPTMTIYFKINSIESAHYITYVALTEATYKEFRHMIDVSNKQKL